MLVSSKIGVIVEWGIQVATVLIFVLKMGFCFILEPYFFSKWKNLFYLFYECLPTLVTFKIQTHRHNFGRISVWSIEKTCSNFSILIHCLWCYFLVYEEDINGFNKCCIYSLILLINWNVCDYPGFAVLRQSSMICYCVHYYVPRVFFLFKTYSHTIWLKSSKGMRLPAGELFS